MIDHGILTAASDFMARLDSTGEVTVLGVGDITKEDGRYKVDGFEMPRVAVEAFILDMLGADLSLLDEKACNVRRKNEMLAFLGLEDQPPQVITLFARRAERMAAKLADLSKYEPAKNSVKVDGEDSHLALRVTVPMRAKGIVPTGIIFKKEEMRTFNYSVLVCGDIECEVERCYDKDKIRRLLYPAEFKLGAPKKTNEFKLGAPKKTKDFFLSIRAAEHPLVSVGYERKIVSQWSYAKISEHDFMRLLARDVIAREGDSSGLPELFESVNLNTVKDKLSRIVCKEGS